jgi:hypothetical protein
MIVQVYVMDMDFVEKKDVNVNKFILIMNVPKNSNVN